MDTTPEQFFFSLLRISTAQMLRHAGLAGSRPSVLDTLTDMTARYLTLLGATAHAITESTNRTDSELSDALSAMEHLGLLRPLTIYLPDYDDTRAVDSFITWAKSPEVEELRKLAGVVTVEVDDVLDHEISGDATTVPDTAAPASQKEIAPLGSASAVAAVAAKKPATSAPDKPREPETDIPIKRENVDDQPVSMIDVDGISLLEDPAAMSLGASAIAGVNDSMLRSTEPPPDAGEEIAKAKVRLKQVDWFTALRLKEDAVRFNGTILGKHMEKKVIVEGGDSVPVQLPAKLPTVTEQQQQQLEKGGGDAVTNQSEQ
ncbi:hypothetical protein ABW21_db0206121 [Orbilia brochopaga]|nr:hypothetical protein ABW21_db0206121 [Drechslerella brochopaga]